jgi:glycosyltransferase involved in cell wall biosynthesis
MNILFVAEYYFANPDFVRISQELARRKHNVSVATSLRTVDRRSREKNVEISEIEPLVTIHKIPHTLSFPILQMSRIVKEQDIDVIHALNDHSTNVATAALISKVSGRPFVYTLQGITTKIGHPLVDSTVSLYDLTVERWIAGEARKVILLAKGLTPAAVNRLKIEPSKIVVVPSGVDYSRFNPELPSAKEKASELKDELNLNNEIIIGYVGRLFPAKGLTYLLSALKRIQDQHANITLLVVGDGAQRYDLEAMAKDLKIRTIFAGFQRDTRPFYSLMDIFVLPSLFEGLPNVILEAMAMKKAIIATNVGGNPELIEDGQNGFLVPLRNVESIADNINTLILDANLREKMGCTSRRIVEERFSWDVIIPNMEKVYTEVSTPRKV